MVVTRYSGQGSNMLKSVNVSSIQQQKLTHRINPLNLRPTKKISRRREAMALSYKKTENGNIAVDDKGLPMVFDDETGKELAIDAIHLYDKIPSLQEEAKRHRLDAVKYKEALAPFEGITDPAKALEALRTVDNLTELDLKKKDEVDRLLQSTEMAWKTKFDGLNQSHAAALGAKDAELKHREGEVFSALVSSQFSKSPFFSGEAPTTNLIPEIAESYFGKHFKADRDENGKRKVVGYIGEHAIYSKTRPGEHADFDECIAEIIDRLPQKDRILIPSEGSGGQGGGNFQRRGVERGDNDAFINNLADIASGKVVVKR